MGAMGNAARRGQGALTETTETALMTEQRRKKQRGTTSSCQQTHWHGSVAVRARMQMQMQKRRGRRMTKMSGK